MTKLEILWFQFVRGNLTAILLMIAVLCIFIFFSINDATLPRKSGFGPEWECISMIQGDPICIKKKPIDPDPAKSK